MTTTCFQSIKSCHVNEFMCSNLWISKLTYEYLFIISLILPKFMIEMLLQYNIVLFAIMKCHLGTLVEPKVSM